MVVQILTVKTLKSTANSPVKSSYLSRGKYQHQIIKTIYAPVSRYVGVTDKAPPLQTYKQKVVYHASTQPKAQKSLESHHFQLVTAMPLVLTQVQERLHMSQSMLVGDFSLTLRAYLKS